MGTALYGSGKAGGSINLRNPAVCGKARGHVRCEEGEVPCQVCGKEAKFLSTTAVMFIQAAVHTGEPQRSFRIHQKSQLKMRVLKGILSFCCVACTREVQETFPSAVAISSSHGSEELVPVVAGHQTAFSRAEPFVCCICPRRGWRLKHHGQRPAEPPAPPAPTQQQSRCQEMLADGQELLCMCLSTEDAGTKEHHLFAV
ncbi:hypothetical protein Anapl_11130 [Anas platyrhynchos]|uniref:Uncharacterized protein n=1 Tax=Anas platyrhynchos TaxID=8839 RepID=R0KQF7_ANAPL|nr:hypothetical protein Anapl_11130 [Anas platyrhynchos]